MTDSPHTSVLLSAVLAGLNVSATPDGLFIDGKEVRTGPPPSYEKIKRLIEKRVRNLV